MSIQDDQFTAEQVNFVNNQPRPPYSDPHSNTYNPGWRNHPNFSWEGTKDGKFIMVNITSNASMIAQEIFP
ncbi:hypothetical protein PIB30_097696, partial [Stylosanthes scabra]|nr:hypothetical protein [Stylosanthes scabra]